MPEAFAQLDKAPKKRKFAPRIMKKPQIRHADGADLLSVAPVTQVSKPSAGLVQLSARSSLAEAEASQEQSESAHGLKSKRSGSLDTEPTDRDRLLLQSREAEMEVKPSSHCHMILKTK